MPIRLTHKIRGAVLGIAARVTAPTYATLYDGTWVHPAVVPAPEPAHSGPTG
jgi:hypothetical protein